MKKWYSSFYSSVRGNDDFFLWAGGILGVFLAYRVIGLSDLKTDNSQTLTKRRKDCGGSRGKKIQ